jgi:hypothetical protein
LRGALAIALAIIVSDSEYMDEENGNRFLFYVAGIATLTIVINGTLASKVLAYLELISVKGSFEEEVIKKNLLQVIIDSNKSAHENKEKSGLEVDAKDSMVRGLSTVKGGAPALNVDYDTVNVEMLMYLRSVFLDIVGVGYHHIVSEGRIPRVSSVAQFLYYTVEAGADNVQYGLKDWDVVVDYLDDISPVDWVLIYLMRFIKMQFLAKIVASVILNRNKRAIFVLQGFIEAQQHAQKKIGSFIGNSQFEGMKASPEELAVCFESAANVRLMTSFVSLYLCIVVSLYPCIFVSIILLT